jgi:hypothetical protein
MGHDFFSNLLVDILGFQGIINMVKERLYYFIKVSEVSIASITVRIASINVSQYK